MVMSHKEYCRLWYEKNRERKLEYQNEYNKKTKYASEKTAKQRHIRYIKRETRRLYPLEGKRCVVCNRQATEHHHTTDPITKHDFKSVCHKCHRRLHWDTQPE